MPPDFKPCVFGEEGEERNVCLLQYLRALAYALPFATPSSSTQYTSPPLSMGAMLHDPPWMPETTDSFLIYTMNPVYTTCFLDTHTYAKVSLVNQAVSQMASLFLLQVLATSAYNIFSFLIKLRTFTFHLQEALCAFSLADLNSSITILMLWGHD